MKQFQTSLIFKFYTVLALLQLKSGTNLGIILDLGFKSLKNSYLQIRDLKIKLGILKIWIKLIIFLVKI
jgi:hypothetical protein